MKFINIEPVALRNLLKYGMRKVFYRTYSIILCNLIVDVVLNRLTLLCDDLNILESNMYRK